MNIDYQKLFAGAILTALITLPVASALTNKTNQLEIQKTNVKNLKLHIQKKDSELDKKSKEIKNQKKQNGKLKQKNKQLQKDLVSKRKKQEQARLAIANKKQIATGVNRSGNCEDYRPLVKKYNWNADIALAVMSAESVCNPTAASPTNDHGLMQINQGLGIYGQQIYDPAFNVRIAYQEKYLKGGWRHWTVCTRGIVNCFI